MTQYYFIRTDKDGKRWLHVHSSYIKAKKAIKWWNTQTLAVFTKIQKSIVNEEVKPRIELLTEELF